MYLPNKIYLDKKNRRRNGDDNDGERGYRHDMKFLNNRYMSCACTAHCTVTRIFSIVYFKAICNNAMLKAVCVWKSSIIFLECIVQNNMWKRIYSSANNLIEW